MKPTTIKSIIFTAIALLVLTVQSFAAYVPKETVHKIHATIKEQVKHPGFDKVQENTCCADVFFSISENGALLIKRIISDNEAISDYLNSKLSEIRFDKMKSPVNQLYRIKFSFKLV